MPEITFICPHCSGQLQTDSEDSGESGECPYCSNPIVIPEMLIASALVETEKDNSPDSTTADLPHPPSNDTLPQDPAIPTDKAPSVGRTDNRSGKSWGQWVRSLYEIKPYESGWTCPACNGLNPEDNTVCRDCGKPITPSPPPVPEGFGLGNGWLNFYVDILIPLRIILYVLSIPLIIMQMSGSPVPLPGGSPMNFVLLGLHIYLFWSLKNGSLIAWKVNMGLLVFQAMWAPIELHARGVEMNVGLAVVFVILVLVTWTLPNLIYFSRRKHLFKSA